MMMLMMMMMKMIMMIMKMITNGSGQACSTWWGANQGMVESSTPPKGSTPSRSNGRTSSQCDYAGRIWASSPWTNIYTQSAASQKKAAFVRVSGRALPVPGFFFLFWVLGSLTGKVVAVLRWVHSNLFESQSGPSSEWIIFT